MIYLHDLCPNTFPASIKVRVDNPEVEWYPCTFVYATPKNWAFDIGLLLIKNYKTRLNWPKRITVSEITEGNVFLCIINTEEYGMYFAI